MTSAKIVGLNGQPVGIFSNTCGTSINAGQGCVILGSVAQGNSYTCIVTTTGADSSGRGSLQIGTFATPGMVALPLESTASAPGPRAPNPN